MFSNESPFSLMSNQSKNNYFQFKNDLSNQPSESNNNDFFSIGNNPQQNYQSKTKQRFAFYNNGTPSQIKECLDYFLNEPNANINIIYYAGNNLPLNSNKIENESEKKFNNSSKNESINSSLNKNNFNNSNNKNDVMSEIGKDGSCPPPPSKNSVNSCLSVSTFNSSINSLNNNNYNDNCLEGKMKIDLLAKDLGFMNLNDGKMLENKEKNAHINENRDKIFHNNINIKKTSNNPNLAKRVSKLTIDY